MMRSLVMFLRQAEAGFRSTKNSAILMGLGSVPSSGRPAFEMTVRTSGTHLSSRRICAQRRVASDTEMPGGDDDQHGAESRPAYFGCRIEDDVADAGPVGSMFALGQTAKDVLNNNHRAVDDNAKIHRPQGE